MVRTPVTITVTGAARNIGYALLFRITSGAPLGSDTPMYLNLLEILQAVKAAEGTTVEPNDSAFPLPESVNVYDGIDDAFDGTDVALLVGARPRTKGVERADLLEANGRIFGPRDKAINDHTAGDAKVLIIGNPANTNAVIATHSALNVPKSCFITTMRLDHNRAISQLATKAGTPVVDTKKMTVWGNRPVDQYPDISYAIVTGKPASEPMDAEWLESFFIPTVAKHDAAIIEARGTSSATLVVSATIDHVCNWANDVPEGDWVTPGVYQDRSYYDVLEGFIFNIPATAGSGEWVVIDDLEVSDRTRARIEHNVKAAQEKLDTVRVLGPIK